MGGEFSLKAPIRIVLAVSLWREEGLSVFGGVEPSVAGGNNGARCVLQLSQSHTLTDSSQQ